MGYERKQRKLGTPMANYCWPILVVTLTGITATTLAYEASQGPTELIQYDPARAYEGYTLFTPMLGRNTYLIDMHGQVVNMWPTPESWWEPEIRESARLLEDGTLLRAKTVGNGSTPGTYQLVDWDGEVIWEYKSTRAGYSGHHDFRMIWNPKLEERTLLYTSTREIAHEAALALGLDPTLRESYASRPDGLVEVDMDGNVLWEWNISDHLVQDFNPDLPTYGVINEHPERLDPNFGTGVSGNWIHINGFDYNETLDHVVVNNSRLSEFYVIDHGSTFILGDPEQSVELAAGKAGDFIYRWGNACVYDSGDCPSMTDEGLSTSNGDQQVFFSHDIQWISDREVRPFDGEIPGAGHFLIFNNGARQPGPTFSSVIELNPYDGPMGKGVYVPQTVAGYERLTVGGGMSSGEQNVSKQVVWRFNGTVPNSFYSMYISGVQRLPNGNTMICPGAHGHIFEVTEDGDIVWEYINPVGDRTGDAYGIYKIMTDQAGDAFNSIFKCHRYSSDYAGLRGKDLTLLGYVTEIFAEEAARP